MNEIKPYPAIFYGMRWKYDPCLWDLADGNSPQGWRTLYANAHGINPPKGQMPVHHEIIQTSEEKDFVKGYEHFAFAQQKAISKSGCEVYRHHRTREIFIIMTVSITESDSDASHSLGRSVLQFDRENNWNNQLHEMARILGFPLDRQSFDWWLIHA